MVDYLKCFQRRAESIHGFRSSREMVKDSLFDRWIVLAIGFVVRIDLIFSDHHNLINLIDFFRLKRL